MNNKECHRCGKPINHWGLCDECNKWLENYCKGNSQELISRKAVMQILYRNKLMVWPWAEEISKLPVIEGSKKE